MKKFKSIIAMLLCAVLLFQPITACAAIREIEVSYHVLDQIKDVLEICKYWFSAMESNDFKFDTKTKTDMASLYLVINSDTGGMKLSTKDVKSVLKSFFGNDKTNKENEKYITSLYSGEFGNENPLLLIKKILYMGKETYKISVISMSKYPAPDEYTDDDYFYNGEYEIGLKSGDYTFGYIITSIVKK